MGRKKQNGREEQSWEKEVCSLGKPELRTQVILSPTNLYWHSMKQEMEDTASAKSPVSNGWIWHQQ